MRYNRTIVLKDGAECLLRHAEGSDAREVCDSFRRTHGQTDFLLSYPDEDSFSEEQERRFLTDKENSGNEAELCAVVGGRIAGTAGVEAVGRQEKIRHRATFGISVEKDCWGRGIGRALTAACIECAGRAGYRQLELEVVRDNARALALYRSVGFTEYGRNPRGFLSRSAGWQETVLMRRELD